MKSNKMTEAEFDCLMDLGKSIQEIHFSELPDEAILEALCENSDAIKIHLPLTKHFCLIGAYPYENSLKKHIISVNFETDFFIDSNYLDEYTSLKHLVLTCSNSDVEKLAARDLGDMWFSISELQQIETLRFDVKQMQDQAIEQLKEQFHFPGRDISVEFTERKKSRIERMRSKCKHT